MTETLKAYADLLRIHFFFAWPLLFCAGLALGAARYGTFSWELLIKGALIGFFGFEARNVRRKRARATRSIARRAMLKRESRE